jgi:hypothetical protein
MNSFDVRIFAIRHRPGRRVFEVRWRVADRDKSRCLMTRALADSYRAACSGLRRAQRATAGRVRVRFMGGNGGYDHSQWRHVKSVRLVRLLPSCMTKSIHG